MKAGHSHAGRITFSPDGRQIAAYDDLTLRVWNAISGLEAATLNGPWGGARNIAWTQDGRRIMLASLGNRSSGEIELWEAATGKKTATLKGHTGYVNGVALSPDGMRVASSSDDQTVKLWDTATGRETITLRGNTGDVYSVAFSSDGMRVASGGGDQIVVWDARPWTPELRVELRALGLVRFLFGKKLSREQVIDRITHDPTLTGEQRERALEFARKWKVD